MVVVTESPIRPECGEKENNSATTATVDGYNPDVVYLGQMKKEKNSIPAQQQLGSVQWMTSPTPV